MRNKAAMALGYEITGPLFSAILSRVYGDGARLVCARNIEQTRKSLS